MRADLLKVNWSDISVRNIPILAFSQALGMSGPPILILLGGIIGADLAPTPALATLPISLLVVGVALFSIPAALLMKKFGRRAGFSSGSLLAAGGSLLAAASIVQGSFYLLCLASLLIGANGAFMQQYRFAAAESAGHRSASRAVSVVLLGGVFAGFFGPRIATLAKDWLPWGEFTGSFFALALIYAGAAVLLLFLKNVLPQEEVVQGPERSIKEIASQPVFMAALLSGAVAYGSMSFIMTATPLHLHHNQHFSLAETSWIIQSHIMAMYLPSLFTGFLMEKLGILRVMLLGIFSMTACVVLAIMGYDLAHYWGALVLLGVGWNFLFVGATVLLTRSYQSQERFKAQASNDFTIFGVQAFSSLSAGTVLYYSNWVILQLGTLPFLILVFAVLIGLRRQIRATT